MAGIRREMLADEKSRNIPGLLADYAGGQLTLCAVAGIKVTLFAGPPSIAVSS